MPDVVLDADRRLVTATGRPITAPAANNRGRRLVLATHMLKRFPLLGSRVRPTETPSFTSRFSIMISLLGVFIDKTVMRAGTTTCERGGVSTGSCTITRRHL